MAHRNRVIINLLLLLSLLLLIGGKIRRGQMAFGVHTFKVSRYTWLLLLVINRVQH